MRPPARDRRLAAAAATAACALAAAAAAPAQTADPAVDIVHQADRLRARLHPTTAYTEPARDPFRFGARPKPSAPVTAPRPAETPVTPLAVVPPAPTLRIALSGIAEDTSGGTLVRTAVISMPDDVLLVKEGDTIAGQYRVTSITSARLSRSPPRSSRCQQIT